jgi:acetyltransferase-like isoleucine patch superfamily enzyme
LTRLFSLLPRRWRRWAAGYWPNARVRKRLWQSTGVRIGEESFTGIGMVVVDDAESPGDQVVIGDRVSMGPGVTFVVDSRPNNSALMQAIPEVQEITENRPIAVADDAWLGAQVTIRPGTRIGRGAVVGAGAVVTGDVRPFTLSVGVPARAIRRFTPPDEVAGADGASTPSL